MEGEAPVTDGLQNANVTHRSPDQFTDGSKKIVAIEGGRSIAARDVQAEFAKQTEELSHEYDTMAGFAILVWDDEGDLSSAVHFGRRSSFAPVLIPGIASDVFKLDVVHRE